MPSHLILEQNLFLERVSIESLRSCTSAATLEVVVANREPEMSTRTTPGTIHLLHEHHSLGYITGVTHHTAKSTSSTAADAVGEAQCHLFAGLPYALPPIGPYRFRRPRPLPPCHRYGTQSNPGVFTGGAGVCPQPAFREEMRPESWEEDCLQANVWVPVGDVPAGGGLPFDIVTFLTRR